MQTLRTTIHQRKARQLSTNSIYHGFIQRWVLASHFTKLCIQRWVPASHFTDSISNVTAGCHPVACRPEAIGDCCQAVDERRDATCRIAQASWRHQRGHKLAEDPALGCTWMLDPSRRLCRRFERGILVPGVEVGVIMWMVRGKLFETVLMKFLWVLKH